MASALTAPRWRVSHPDRVESDLSALWRELAQESPVSRAILANLVVVSHRPKDVAVDPAQPPLDVPVAQVVEHHPSRVIVLYHDSTAGLNCAPLTASVGILTFGAAPFRFGVERIVVQSACTEASLPSIVRRLTLGGVPTSVWWTDDLARVPPVGALISMGRQLVYDSRRWSDVRSALRALAPMVEGTHRLDLADANWHRFSAVRQTLVHAIETNAGMNWQEGGDVRIRHRSGESALAWLCAGWLETGPAGSVDLAAQIEEDTHQLELLKISAGSLTLTLTAHAAVVHPARTAPPMVVAVPRRTEADWIASELGSLEQNRPLLDSLRILCHRVATSRSSARSV